MRYAFTSFSLLVLLTGCAAAPSSPNLHYFSLDWNTYRRPSLIMHRFAHDSSDTPSVKMFRWQHGPISKVPGPSEYPDGAEVYLVPQGSSQGLPATELPADQKQQESSVGQQGSSTGANTLAVPTESSPPAVPPAGPPIQIDVPPELRPPSPEGALPPTAPKVGSPIETAPPPIEEEPALPSEANGPTASNYRRHIQVQPASSRWAALPTQRTLFARPR